MDDDTATKCLLRQKYKEQQEEAHKKNMVYVWPMQKGKQDKDTGMLPLSHPNPVFLADPNHRLRGMFGKIYKLATKKKEDSKCTKMDAARLKYNGTIAVHSNRKNAESLELFSKFIMTVVEHQFNNHSDCGDWCPFIKCNGNEEMQSKL